MDFTSIVDQIFLFLIVVVTLISLVIPINRYLKDRAGYPLFQVISTCFYLDSAFAAFVTLLSYIRSIMTLNGFDKAFDALISFQIPASLYGLMAVMISIVAVGLRIVYAER